MKISVIIPIYNKEKTIKKTVESVLNQTIEQDKIEILLINDGSTDDTQKIINEYAQQYSNTIKAFEKQNGGLSDARNYGIKQATGDYIILIDAGDYIEKNLFKNLEQYIDKEIDVIKFKLQTVDEEGYIIQRLDGPVFEMCTGEEAYLKLATFDNFIDSACIYLYKKEFWDKHQFKYAENTYHEDFGLTSIIILNANTVVSVNKYGYYYVQDADSITRDKDYNKTVNRANDLLKHYDIMLGEIEKINVSDKAKQVIKTYYTNAVILGTQNLKGKDRKEYIKQIKQRKLIDNIQTTDFKQIIKKILLKTNINLYLKIRR